jgi:pimeloyl-ACP methyl ester carboxylesterase
MVRPALRRWIRWAFLFWAVAAHAWLINSVRTQGVSDELLRSTQGVRVLEGSTGLEFRPASQGDRSALIFICGSGIHAHAYAPLLRPIADTGYPVFIVKLPYRFAPLASHKDEVVERTLQLMASHPETPRWVVAGHSLGGALAARVALATRGRQVSFVLIGTTHPRDHDLSKLEARITKVYATNDGVAPVDAVVANRRLLPETTAWVEIKGGNHSQFGHYGHQLFDGTATITREAQQAMTRQVLLDALGVTERRE